MLAPCRQQSRHHPLWASKNMGSIALFHSQFDTLAFSGYNEYTVLTGGEPMLDNRSCSLCVRSASCDR